MGGAGGGIVSHFLFVSLIGVKKRTKVIKNSVNPVWNEVCEFLLSLLSSVSAPLLTLWGQEKGLVQERSLLSCIVKEGRGWWSRVPTKFSRCWEPGRMVGAWPAR